MSKPGGRWRARHARKDQGPLPEGGSETYVYSLFHVPEGRADTEGELLLRIELTPEQYLESGGRRGVDAMIEAQRRSWARLARTKGHPGSVIVTKTRGYRRSVWQVPMATSGITQP